ncbi:MAG TPA: hypothetical protein GXX75_07140 [Clostridiales bacterium]|nr:hypothetical protein [Clostridiales bacterium]
MKNRIYKRLKQFFIMLSICTTLLSGPVAGNEVRKMLKCMDERNAIMREINGAENEENSGDKLKRKSTPYK